MCNRRDERGTGGVGQRWRTKSKEIKENTPWERLISLSEEFNWTSHLSTYEPTTHPIPNVLFFLFASSSTSFARRPVPRQIFARSPPLRRSLFNPPTWRAAGGKISAEGQEKEVRGSERKTKASVHRGGWWFESRIWSGKFDLPLGTVWKFNQPRVISSGPCCEEIFGTAGSDKVTYHGPEDAKNNREFIWKRNRIFRDRFFH